jgi:hypothetical protein
MHAMEWMAFQMSPLNRLNNKRMCHRIDSCAVYLDSVNVKLVMREKFYLAGYVTDYVVFYTH